MSDYMVSVLSFICIESFVALSTYLLLITGQISFGQQAYFGIGAFTGGAMTAMWGFDLSTALIVGGLVAGAAAAMVGALTFRLGGLYFAIATLSFAELMRLTWVNLIYQIEVDGFMVGPKGAEGFRDIRYVIDNGISPGGYLGVIASCLFAIVVFFIVLERSRFGLALRMVDNDETGAGKTSTMMAISGVVAPESGRIRFQGDDIASAPSHDIYRRGIVQVPEGRLIFSELTVRDNLLLGAHVHGVAERANPDLDAVFELFPVLRERLRQRADTLSGGQLQMLAIARGLMGRPKLFMLDEPSLGLAPLVAEEVFGLTNRLNQRGMTILLVEQNVRKALEISDRAYLLEAGRLVESGEAAGLLTSDLIMQSYLGTRAATATESENGDFTLRVQAESEGTNGIE